MDLTDRVEAGDVTDVSNSTAFMELDRLLEERKIVEERAELLKAKYKELHERVLTIYSNDNFLLKRARASKKELEKEKERVEKCGEVASQDDSAIVALKKELADVELDLSSAQEKESMLNVEALELERKKQTLEHDVRESIAQENAKLRPLIDQNEREIEGLSHECKKVEADISERERELAALKDKESRTRQDVGAVIEEIQRAKIEYARIEKEPDRARTQTESVLRNLIGGKKEVQTVSDRQKSLTQQQQELKERKADLEATKAKFQRTFDTNHIAIERVSKMLSQLMKGHQDANEKLQSQLQRLGKIEQHINEAVDGLARQREEFVRLNRDREAELKTYKKIDQAKSDLTYESEMVLKQMEVLGRQKQRLIQQRAEASATLEELKRDVDILVNNFLREETMEKRSISDKEEMIRLVNDLERDVAQRSNEEQEQRRVLAAKAMLREQVSHDASRNKTKLDMAKNELKVQMRVYEEFTKQLDDLRRKHSDAMKRYGVVKREKSVKAKQISDASHLMSETQEKMKMLEEELQSKRRESVLKDAELKKKEREEYKLRQHCKKLRVDRHKIGRKKDAAHLRQQDLKQQMTKLNTIITATEQDMIALKHSYEEAVENRNFTGIQLIDRNDELCVLYEKANVQEGILKRGMLELMQRDKHIRKLSIQLADLQREIDLCQRLLPQARDLEEDLAEVCALLEDERWRAEVLENDITDPENPHRWRKLEKIGKSRLNRARQQKQRQEAAASSNKQQQQQQGGGGEMGNIAGKDTRVASDDLIELSEKQQQLETRLAEVNERLMEKELVLEELTELSSRLRKQANDGREFTRDQAKRVNAFQFGIKARTKRMMATLSELSMVQASTIKMEMDVRNAEESLAAARARAQQGLAPTDDVAERFEKDRRNEERMNEVLRQRKAREQADLASPDALRTKAEKRASQYIPDNDALGLPLPFGAHAPFKPTLQSHNVHRFTRKPRILDVSFDE